MHWMIKENNEIKGNSKGMEKMKRICFSWRFGSNNFHLDSRLNLSNAEGPDAAASCLDKKKTDNTIKFYDCNSFPILYS